MFLKCLHKNFIAWQPATSTENYTKPTSDEMISSRRNGLNRHLNICCLRLLAEPRLEPLRMLCFHETLIPPPLLKPKLARIKDPERKKDES